MDEQDGVLPPAMAKTVLRLSNTGLWNAGERGGLKFFQLGGVRYYGRKSALDYRWTISRKFRDNACRNPLPPEREGM